MVSRFMARRAATIGETVQVQQLSGKWEEQAQHLSAGTAQPEDQPLGGGISSGFGRGGADCGLFREQVALQRPRGAGQHEGHPSHLHGEG